MLIWITTFEGLWLSLKSIMGQNRPKKLDFLPKSMKSNLVAFYCANRSPIAIIDKKDRNWSVCGLFS